MNIKGIKLSFIIIGIVVADKKRQSTHMRVLLMGSARVGCRREVLG